MTPNPDTQNDNAATPGVPMANGEVRQTQMRLIDANALLMIQQDVASGMPPSLVTQLQDHFNRTVFEFFIQPAEEVVKFQSQIIYGVCSGDSIQFSVNAQVEGKNSLLPLVFQAHLDKQARADAVPGATDGTDTPSSEGDAP